MSISFNWRAFPNFRFSKSPYDFRNFNLHERYCDNYRESDQIDSLPRYISKIKIGSKRTMLIKNFIGFLSCTFYQHRSVSQRSE